MRLALLVLSMGLALVACSTAPPPLPAGIAELYLPRDSRTLARLAAEEDSTRAIGRRRDVLTDRASS